jgi:hypothetical protein
MEHFPYTPLDINVGDIVKWNPLTKPGTYRARRFGVYTEVKLHKAFTGEYKAYEHTIRNDYGVLSINGSHYPRASLLVKGVDYE